MTIARALISVYDKNGIAELAGALHAAGVEIVSTGSTAATIAAAGVPVVQVADVTGFPEILDGRVKTLHPRIHGGILADRRKPEHEQTLAEHDIAGIDLVVANLYPFSQTVASGAGVEECIEQIDIGGPAMVRAAAKNHANTAVIVSPKDYPQVVAVVEAGTGFSADQRRELAVKAFRHTADYDVAVASWLGSLDASESFPGWVAATWQRAEVLRYGENPHQRAALYINEHADGLAHAEQLHGKQMSYNNFVDGDAAHRSAWDFAQPAAAIIKHANPCGIAVGEDLLTAYRAAFDTDPVSAFGGVVAVNRPVTKDVAEAMSEIFLEVVIAPAFEPDALEVLTGKQNIRLLVAPPRHPGAEVRFISGGMLMQSPDRIDAAWRRPGHVDARVRRAGRRGHAARPGIRLARLPCGEVERHPAGQGRGGGRDRDGSGQPGGFGPAGCVACGRGARRRGGGRLRCVLPVPRWTRSAPRSGGAGRRPARGVGARRGGHRGGPSCRSHHVPDRDKTLLPLTGHGPGMRGVEESAHDCGDSGRQTHGRHHTGRTRRASLRTEGLGYHPRACHSARWRRPGQPLVRRR